MRVASEWLGHFCCFVPLLPLRDCSRAWIRDLAAAELTMDSEAGLRAGDALPLACAMQAKAQGIVTLDVLMAKNARLLKLKPVSIDKAKHSP